MKQSFFFLFLLFIVANNDRVIMGFFKNKIFRVSLIFYYKKT